MSRCLGVFCNPRGTDALRLQSEQRVLQLALRRSAVDLSIAPAATVDDLQQALLHDAERFDLIHFSGHGCIEGPLQSMVKAAMAARPGHPWPWEPTGPWAQGRPETYLQRTTAIYSKIHTGTY